MYSSSSNRYSSSSSKGYSNSYGGGSNGSSSWTDRYSDSSARRDYGSSDKYSSRESGGYGGFNGGSYGGGGGFSSSGGLGADLDTNIQWDLSTLPKFEKNFYYEHPDVTRRSPNEYEQWKKDHDITVFGKNVPKCVYSFEEASFPGKFACMYTIQFLYNLTPMYKCSSHTMIEYVLNEVMRLGFEKPTPIQCQGWPMALSGRDMVGISATGSGKTLAFLLPAIVHINAQVCVISST
jgi:ATP-dependent RNA helicase DDX5/DBP2